MLRNKFSGGQANGTHSMQAWEIGPQFAQAEFNSINFGFQHGTTIKKNVILINSFNYCLKAFFL